MMRSDVDTPTKYSYGTTNTILNTLLQSHVEPVCGVPTECGYKLGAGISKLGPASVRTW